MVARTVCTADITGYEQCNCAECAAMVEADYESEFLAEVGASYAYSGIHGSDAMQLAREDLRYQKMRREVPDMRAEFAALRLEWVSLPFGKERIAAFDRMVAIAAEANRALHGYDSSSTRDEVIAALAAWRRRTGR